MNRSFPTLLITLLVATAFPAWAQEEVTMAFSDPSRPGRLVVSLFSGGITVTGYDGDAVVVRGTGLDRLSGSPPERAEGLRRISSAGVGLTVEEADNTIEINANSPFHGLSNLTIQVPSDTSLELHTMSGEIQVAGTSGEIQVESMSGTVRLEQVAGSALVDSLHGDIVATFFDIDQDMPMSFSAFSGEIDLTLPARVEASLKMRSTSGEIFTDFDFDLESSGEVIDESQEERRRVRVDRTLAANLNGGGPEIQLTTFHGNIYVRRGD